MSAAAVLSFTKLYYAISVLWGLAFALELSARKRRDREALATVFWGVGAAVLVAYFAHSWQTLERPPLRTLGETRVLYALFLPLIGFGFWFGLKERWVLLYGAAMSYLFLTLNFAHLDVFDKTMMPALRSYWFVPHVVVYLFAYAFLGVACLIALRGAWLLWRESSSRDDRDNAGTRASELISSADRSVAYGFMFLTCGLVFGAFWAKEAWGSYWTWDPKETWACLTWLAFLFYIHIRHGWRGRVRLAYGLLIGAFTVLLLCWFGVGYLPATQNSVHAYGVTGP